VADDALAQSIYTSMISIDGLRPCDFTIPNFPDYDDSCGSCDGGFGTWVSGVITSILLFDNCPGLLLAKHFY
jgi:hypothetical protein